jgi:hypothetical protein
MPNIGHRAIGIPINSLFIIMKFYITLALYILCIYVLYANTMLLRPLLKLY